MLASSSSHVSLFSSQPAVAQTLTEARRAQANWAAQPLETRLQRIAAFRHLLATRSSQVAGDLQLPERQLAAESFSAEIVPLASACRYLEAHATNILTSRVSGGPKARIPGGVAARVERVPWGLVLVICAGNYPLYLPGVQVVQALVAGNAVAIKPAPGTEAPLTGLVDLLVEAGIEPGLLVLLDESVESVQRVLSVGVDKVLFTGSSRTGRLLLTQLADTLTPATLELSGCDAVFIHPDADLTMVTDALVFGLTFNASATCIAPRRVFVPESRAPELESLLAARIAELEPIPVTAERQHSLQELVVAALSGGARLVSDRSRFEAGLAPVVLADVRPEMELARTDLFAPVLSLLAVTDFDRALTLDAACPYALGASVFGPRRVASEWARRVDAGVVVVNDLIAPTVHPDVPFGGSGESGFGVTRGAEGLLDLTRTRTIVERRGKWRPHYDRLQQGDEELFESWLRARHGRRWAQRLQGWIDLARAARRKARQGKGS